MRAANSVPGSSASISAQQRHNLANEPGKGLSRLASNGFPPAGVRPLGSTRPELGLQRPSNSATRAARIDSTALRQLPTSQRRPNVSSSQSQDRVRVESFRQSSSGPSSSFGSRHEQIGGAFPSSSTIRPPYQPHQSASDHDHGPTSQTVQPGGGLPSSSTGVETNVSQRHNSALRSPGRKSKKAKDRKHQKYQPKRGPARPGRTMQTIEHPGMDISLSPVTPPTHDVYSRPLRPATPGPSSLSRGGLSHEPSPPGLFVTPHTPHDNMPFASSPTRAPQSRGKRPRDETDDLDPATRKAEWERMVERIQKYETEMDRTRGQLEMTNQILEDQRRRLEDLEHQRRIYELVQELERQGPVEQPQIPVEDNDELHVDEGVQHGHGHDHQRWYGGQRQHGGSLEEQQSEAWKREPEGRCRDAHQHGRRQRTSGQRHREEPQDPKSDDEGQHIVKDLEEPVPAVPQHHHTTQRWLKHRILQYPLSGHDPELSFDDDDRPNVSEATVFLLRLSQQEVHAKFSKYIKDKEFFDLDHPGFKYQGCWAISGEASFDFRMKLWDRGEKHTLPFRRLAIRMWHDELSMYRLLQGKMHQKAVPVCHNKHCMRPDHIQVESSKEYGERRKCKKMGRCDGHVTTHKDGTVQQRMSCIFAPPLLVE